MLGYLHLILQLGILVMFIIISRTQTRINRNQIEINASQIKINDAVKVSLKNLDERSRRQN